MNDDFPYYTVTEAAAKARESYMTIRRRIEAGVIRTLNTSAGFLIEKTELDRYLTVRGSKEEGRSYYRSSHFNIDDEEGVSDEGKE